ncbi:hypothetical protein A3A84_02245 [Candidatus Collierbacteria bacterium RIFCSPLOWO2_01_FULL_50_23]|uniref:Uncharacterized protein n=2 Tax=Candidatus Collieribacteriota TaxID=1752725 RepID=A0A1F5EY52_9BACT|nr:MAG: hypothetical protein A2703_02390 [Candidatus Collierbacteria bacterium RIFCSPHIGHO2_01_FULL_50_25]OGD72064.1 MAG: hypothetical protein A3D09_02100 [Candidatus Collierbacteria bacterium RIFCSPHIGHO2_02_FULL_49_10]OGD73779.1 MAG: hypothetical protein A3A84_02245 [Candidatus Collierbacteria bacterium RIFCSPLOWO2_01_FULL_50_23]
MASNKLLPEDTLDLIPGIGPAFQKTLARLDLHSLRDLLHHYPSRYLDYRIHTPIKDLTEKKDVSFVATIGEPNRFVSRTGKLIIQAIASDKTGKIKLTWFNTPYIARVICPGQTYLVAGKTSFWGESLTLVAPIIEPKGAVSLHTHGLVPIYPLTSRLTSRFLRQKVHLALTRSQIKDPLSARLVKENNLVSYQESLTNIHFPKGMTDQLKADERLAFNHHLAINLSNQIEFARLPPAPVIALDRKLHNNLLGTLPFELTKGQVKAVENGYEDLSKNHLTHRLIQGETGSGKTVVVYFYAAVTIAAGNSLCLLAPTEILAAQHYQSFLKLGLSKEQVVEVTAKKPLRHLPGKPAVFIGTHALLTQLPQKLPFPLAVVVIDEQHKFGVEQRQKLTLRDPSPHLFNLTATPIPRTLALGLFGEVAVTTLKQKPKNRLPVKTWIVTPSRYKNSQNWIEEQIRSGSKIFVVTPLIHHSDKIIAESVEKTFLEYQKKYGKLTGVGLIHGQMKPEKIEAAVSAFKKETGGILVSTTIIEVGIDIPEADVIIVHSAERFGLASLHQLRGRVGRGARQSYCLLIPGSDEQEEEDRLRLLEKYHSGLILSKMDLRLRGSGELFGTKQHGWLPVRLKNFWNKNLFRKARVLAKKMVEQNETEAGVIANRLITW